jgi:hypothetical protein
MCFIRYSLIGVFSHDFSVSCLVQVFCAIVIALQAILYGNPVTYLKKPDSEPVGAKAQRESSLEDERQKGRVVNLVTDDPAVRTAPKSFGAYSNFKVTKVRAQAARRLRCWCRDVVILLRTSPPATLTTSCELERRTVVLDSTLFCLGASCRA